MRALGLAGTNMRLLILITLVILAIGDLSSWPRSAGWRYCPVGGLKIFAAAS